eukprot:1608452-Rhodomonas_salina.2
MVHSQPVFAVRVSGGVSASPSYPSPAIPLADCRLDVVERGLAMSNPMALDPGMKQPSESRQLLPSHLDSPTGIGMT